jgi:hypothetical protein
MWLLCGNVFFEIVEESHTEQAEGMSCHPESIDRETSYLLFQMFGECQGYKASFLPF